MKRILGSLRKRLSSFLRHVRVNRIDNAINRRCQKDRKTSPFQLSDDLEQIVWRYALRGMNLINKRLDAAIDEFVKQVDCSADYVEGELGLHGDDAKRLAGRLVDMDKIIEGDDSDIGDRLLQEFNEEVRPMELDRRIEIEVRRRIAVRLRAFTELTQGSRRHKGST